MGESKTEQLNSFFVHVFNEVLSWEEEALKQTCKGTPLTNREIHVIEAVAVLSDGEQNTMANIAKLLAVTPGSLTTSVNALVKKGYLSRSYTPKDRRIIYMTLTENGEKINRIHQQIHLNMIQTVQSEITQGEFDTLLSALGKLNQYFTTKNFSRD